MIKDILKVDLAISIAVFMINFVLLLIISETLWLMALVSSFLTGLAFFSTIGILGGVIYHFLFRRNK